MYSTTSLLVSMYLFSFLQVANVQRQVRQWRDNPGEKKTMCTARPGWQTMNTSMTIKYKERMHQININLVDILDIDTEKR